MTENEIRYALSKQLDSAHTLDSSYGPIQLDDEMRTAIARAVFPILQARLDAMRKWPDFGKWFEEEHGMSLLDAYEGRQITPDLMQEVLDKVADYRADAQIRREAEDYIPPLARALGFDGEG